MILEDRHSKITTYTLSKLAEYNIITFLCDEKHLPNGILIPFAQHSRQVSILEKQIKASKPFKNRMWQQIVSQKIMNQAICLELLGYDEEFKYLYSLARSVDSGDKTNKESIAARYYFRTLFGEDFKRDLDIHINAALNYGYAIIRGAIARGLSTYGLHPSLGIFHHNELNAFNLADDFIEPIRPLVDLWVYTHEAEIEPDLTPQNKLELYSLLGHVMYSKKAKHNIHNVIDNMIKSYVSALKEENAYYQLALPKLIPLEVHSYE